MACRARRRRLLSQFEDLQQCYLRLRNPKKRSAQPLVPTQQSANKQQQPSASQPGAKRIKQEPDIGLQGPSDAASSDPLGGLHPLNSDSAKQLQSKQQNGFHAGEPQSNAVLAHARLNGKASSSAKAAQKGHHVQHHSSTDERAKADLERIQKHDLDQQHGAAEVVGPADEEGLAEFSRMLSVFTHCARLKVIAQLPRTSNAHCSNILSSIEFDRDGQVTF